MKVHAFLAAAAAALCLLPSMADAQQHSITTLEKTDGAFRLVQDGKPFLMLGGEMHNSSSSTPIAAESSYKAAKQMGMNSVIATVSWEQIEPEEGHFDFSEVDHIIALASKYQLRTALIWFGSWKNGESSYPPEWVKADVRRFERVRNSKGENTTQLSPFCKETLKADSKAYKALMSYIASHDTDRMICVMQVENEVGTFEDRDHTKAGEKAYASQVPAQLMNYLQEHKESLSPLIRKAWATSNEKMKGTWAEVFGNNRDGWQVFMAWYYAKFVEEVTKAGKEAHPIPMYANAWLSDDDDRFGIFPNGGPRQCVVDIWKAATEYLDWVSPDVYHPDKRRFFNAYSRDDNPLFIPEISRETGYAYLAFGEYDAIGYAPFGYEELYDDVNMLGEYKVLGEMLPFILENQGTGKMHGFARLNGVDAPDGGTSFVFGDNRINVHYIKGEKSAHGIIIQTGANEFLVAGVGAFFSFESMKDNTVCKLSYAEEVEFDEDGNCTTLFVLNGDETSHHNRFYLRGRMPNPDFENGEFKLSGPLYRPSFQRKDKPEWQERYKVSGIYKIRLYSYPLK